MIWAILLGLAGYSAFYKLGYCSDDIQGIKDRKDKVRILNQSFGISVFDWLWFKVCKQVAWRWHLVVLVYHIVNIAILYIFASRLFGERVGLLASLLFSIHPGTNQGVAWLSGRHYIVISWCMMGAYAFMNTFWAFLPLWAVGALLNPQGAMLSLFALGLRPSWLTLAYFGLFLASMPFYFKELNRRLTQFMWDKSLTKFKVPRMNMFLKILNYYFFMALVPFHLGFYHQGLFGYNTKLDEFNWESVVGFIILASLGAIAFLARNTLPGLTFGILWYFIFLIPCINIVHNNMIFAERYMYTPLVGFCIALASVLTKVSYFPIVTAVILTLYFVRLFSYVLAYRDEFTLFATNIKNHPLSVEAHINQGDRLLRAGNFELSYPLFKRAIEIDPESAIGWFNLGCAQVNLGDPESAMKSWEKAIQINPKYVSPRYNLMRLREELKRKGWQVVAQGELVKA